MVWCSAIASQLVSMEARTAMRKWLVQAVLTGVAALAMAATAVAQDQTTPASDLHAAEQQFNQICAGCHGEGGAGGDRAPALVGNRYLRTRSESQIQDLIKTGTRAGMPGFPFPPDELKSLAHWVHMLNPSAFDSKPAGDVAAGEQFFFAKGQCSICHMARGRGGVNGPDLSDIGQKASVKELELVLDNPTSQIGTHSTPTCPKWAFCPDESWVVVNVRLKNGSTLRGFARNRGEHDLQLQTFDGRLHMLTDTDYQAIARENKSYMPPLRATAEARQNLLAYLSTLGGIAPGQLTVATEPVSREAIEAVTKPKAGEWPTYNGVSGGNRYSPLSQINSENVKQLRLQWIYSLGASGLETTPLVSQGVMYVTGPGEVCAIDAQTGREIWCHTVSSVDLLASGGNIGGANPGAAPANMGAGGPTNFRPPNRGVAILGDRVFFATGDAHLICLNRITGGVMWDVSMPETPGGYFVSSAPLVVGDLVVSGMAGGDTPLRGYLAAYEAATGKLAWRFWTVPKPGEPGSETWIGSAVETGGGATWLTGSYDAETDTLYWTVGNPFPDTEGAEREGLNLYTNCVLALDAKTGKLRWYYQFTPHDLHDWDSVEPLVLVDTNYGGRDRKLLLQANRNGFLYVLDRTNGELLLAKPLVTKLNWASGIGLDGKPQLLPANQPTKEGVKTCPAVRGATNWWSTAFNPATRLFYVMTVEDCSIYKPSARIGAGFEGYRDPSDPGVEYLRAFDIATGKVAWEIPQVGPPRLAYAGVLSTGVGLVFYGENGGGFAAVDAKTGKTLWSFRTNEPWRASPMTYTVNGRQYLAIASDGNILSFALGQ